ncbi:MAG TPA: Gfo/Idh/MocA family oxidoreductase [Burkholderiaceae bacterium]|nr:Gfo/Idh/MocA family oxidoreductase [Burkholderiaceae bacterium]
MPGLNVGIIGTGSMAAAHAEAFRRVRGVRVAACLDVVPGRAEAFALRHGIPLATPQRSALFDAVDAVSIVTPDAFHAEQAIAALDAGKHVLCEKPLAVTLDEARAVARAAARRPDLVGMVNFSYRRSSAMQAATRVVASGRLGDLRHVQAHYLQSWLSADMWGHWSSERFLWRLQTAAGSGGVLGDVGVHIMDLASAVAGPVARVRCDLRTYPKIAGGKRHTRWKGKALDANDTALVTLDFVDGASGVVQATRWATGHTNHLRLEVHGTRGALRFDLDESYQRLQLCVGRDVHRSTWRSRDFAPGPDIWQRFCRAIRTRRHEQPDLLRGAVVQAQLDACLRSARSGNWERVAAVGERAAA